MLTASSRHVPRMACPDDSIPDGPTRFGHLKVCADIGLEGATQLMLFRIAANRRRRAASSSACCGDSPMRNGGTSAMRGSTHIGTERRYRMRPPADC